MLIWFAMMSEIVKEYGDEIYGIIKSLKDLHIDGDDKTKAEMIFSTVHRAKGMEYDVVYLVDDFITEERLDKMISGQKDKEGPLNIAKLNEEINLLYVAVTRARYKLHIPEGLAAKSRQLQPFGKTLEKKKQGDYREKAYTVPEKRQSHKEAYQPWTPELDKELMTKADTGASIGSLAEQFGRTKGAIYARLKKLDYYS